MMWLVYALAAALIWGVNYAVSGRLLEHRLSPQKLLLLDLFFSNHRGPGKPVNGLFPFVVDFTSDT